MKVTEVQRRVLTELLDGRRRRAPRGSLERLEKKGLVEGDRRSGWALTPKGRLWIDAYLAAASPSQPHDPVNADAL